MSFQVNLPPSLVVKMNKEEKEVETGKPKREDWKKLKELEEARKAGTAPAMKDEEGKDINPHIPQYIMQAPWYYGSLQPTLKHQRQPGDEEKEAQQDVARFKQWFKKGVQAGPLAIKYRKGACQNCGALTHKKKDCLERPRKIGAKYTGEDIAPDEHINPELSFDYDGKRDRWNGYDTTEHSRIVEEYAKIDEAKRQLKSNRLETDAEEGSRQLEEAGEQGDSEDGEDDEDKYADHVDMPGQKFETKQRITVRNLRIREDKAKYLYNLDPNSAYYDPKTRSMRENPFQNTGKDDSEVTYAGDNFVRWSGDAHNMAERQMFAWQAYEKGQEAHLQADPTKLELLNKEYKRKKEVYKDDQKQNILSKYGGEEHLEAPPKELLFAQTENYVEYSRTGTLLKGQEKAKVKSRYEEDVYINNHTSVWGSFWKDGSWGYSCCHSMIKESYCTGEAGKEASVNTILNTNSRQIEEASSTPHASHTQQASHIPQASHTPQASQTPQASHSPTSLSNPTTLASPTTTLASPTTTLASPTTTLASPTTTAMATTQESPETKSSEKKKKSKKEKRREKKKRRKEKKRSKKKKRRKESSSESSSSSSSSDSEDEDAAREKRIREAMKKQAQHEKQVDRIMQLDERKRPYNAIYDFKEPTEEEMEAFRRKKGRSDDPMAQFL